MLILIKKIVEKQKPRLCVEHFTIYCVLCIVLGDQEEASDEA